MYWHSNQKERSSFTDLVETFEKYLTTEEQDNYKTLEQNLLIDYFWFIYQLFIFSPSFACLFPLQLVSADGLYCFSCYEDLRHLRLGWQGRARPLLPRRRHVRSRHEHHQEGRSTADIISRIFHHQAWNIEPEKNSCLIIYQETVYFIQHFIYANKNIQEHSYTLTLHTIIIINLNLKGISFV